MNWQMSRTSMCNLKNSYSSKSGGDLLQGRESKREIFFQLADLTINNNKLIIEECQENTKTFFWNGRKRKRIGQIG